ncbi:chromosome partitioning protein ParB [Campylobacter sp. MIT 12-8780]|uniref:ParB/RepB/Spo0J family partition protein n=1 Tax=unclassified Campylobacter TaxID=2593542 RepID=UPI0010F791E1|nr:MULTISPECIES: ParB/RepB/Spo0J family partition protein [unclassified Campylobacter]NDJ27382.1 ParB/RepB/Spo0J family partition protein [Campylobacter sp. MIT 19-121]TKX28507.1 chromosome partitioning protein ParB [Campylobacter sp. MIT 12-5580]TQR40227.1 chromosome partitioning protein ParB [Campylobacter sp. MIT 12-8780]
MAKRSALGRGLSSILGDVDEAYSKELGLDRSRVEEISLELISANPYQPRKHFDEDALDDLAKSIQTYGLLQPIIVFKKENENYVLIAGERRFRACQRLKMPTIKALVAEVEEEKLRELALIENIQREDLNPIELANSYKDLIEHYKITQEELSNKVHKSRSQITNTLRLLQLSKDTQKLIAEGKISQGHAKIMVGLDNKDEKLLIDTILGQKLSVRDAEKIAQKMKKNETNHEIDQELNQELEKFKIKLKKLNISHKAKHEQITLYLSDLEKIKQLNKLLQ